MRKMRLQLSGGKSLEDTPEGDEESCLSLWKELNRKPQKWCLIAWWEQKSHERIHTYFYT